jgi:hypothetical protein
MPARSISRTDWLSLLSETASYSHTASRCRRRCVTNDSRNGVSTFDASCRAADAIP